MLCFPFALFFLKTFQAGAPGITTPEIIIFNIYIPDLHIPGISAEGFFEGVLSALRLLAAFAAAALLFATTTMRELRLSLGAIEKRVTDTIVREVSVVRGYSSPGTIRISLGISLMLGFIPRFFEALEDMNLACDARAGKRGLHRLMIIIPLVTERMMETAAETAAALEARGASLRY